MTPEGQVKAKVRELLGTYGDELYSYWPVPTGFGRTTVDAIGCYRGHFFAIETKAEKKKPTLRQIGELNRIDHAMGRTYVITGIASPELQELRHWLDYLKATVAHDPFVTPDPVNRRTI